MAAQHLLPLGVHVSLTTKQGQTHSGVVFACDPVAKVVVLDVGPTTAAATGSGSAANGDADGKRNYALVALSQVETVTNLSPPQRSEVKQISPVNIERLRKHEQKAIRAAQDAVMRVGVGVSAEAQELFNEISKTYAL